MAARSEIATGEAPQAVRGKDGRRLAIFKALALLALLVVTAYGMLDGGLYFAEEWLPVAAGILGLALLTLFFRDYYANVPKVGWVLVALLGALVAIKGLSLIWTISESLTIQEMLRSAMYLATFGVALAALSYRRQVEPLVDGMVLVLTPVVGYGLLQKINPAEYPIGGVAPGRLNSTLEYANTFAMVVALGIVLGLARLDSLRNPLARGVYAVLLLGFCVALFFTFSRGGYISLGVGLVVFFALTSDRLQGLANLLLLSAPLMWVLLRTRGREALYQEAAPEEASLAAGGALLVDLVVAAVVAFALQALYAAVANRYGIDRGTRRLLGVGAVVSVVLLAGVGGYAAFGAVSGSSGGEGAPAGLQERLTSFDSLRYTYWEVGMEAWRERPLTGTGAGTFEYTWLQERPIDTGVKQIHNLYLEQGTETGIFAFAALIGFAAGLALYTAAAALRTPDAGPGGVGGGRRALLAGFGGAIAVYLFSSALEWHWYISSSTLFFFILAAVAVKYASFGDHERPEP